MSNANKPYLIDAIIGNSSLLASLGRSGRLHRMWWPHIDMPQHIDAMRTGICYDDGRISWFDDEESGWLHSCAYTERSNSLSISASHDEEALAIDSLHFAVPDQNLLVRQYIITNRGETPASFHFVVHSSFLISENILYNTTMFHENDDALIHFRHRYFFAVSSANVCSKFQAGLPWKEIDAGTLDKLSGNVIDMRGDGALAWQIDELEPGASVTIPIFIAAGHSELEALETLRVAKDKPSEQWAAQTDKYWRGYVEAAAPCPLPEEKIRTLYERSLLMFKLMSDSGSGSIIAAPEFDEHFSRCGGYAFCWGRDAAFITSALDRAGLYGLSESFYEWTLRAQSPDGSWQQRHYHDGSLAPSWGLQIDEGASILWGMHQHYLVKRDGNFARKVWPAVERGATFLEAFLDQDSGLPRPSIDLWEEREASHTYSSAAVYGGLTAAADFAQLAGESAKAERWRTAAGGVAKAIEEKCWNEKSRSYYRGLHLTVNQSRYEEALADGKAGCVQPLDKGYIRHILEYDDMPDISLLGISVPFGAVPPDSIRMRSTADALEAALTVPGVGGIKRYGDDHYIGGNPWILTTLWLAQYRIASGEPEKARAWLNWAIDHATESGLLPEQIDKDTGETAWVVPLTWSHAMFVSTVHLLAEAEALQAAAVLP
ncbi:glycoside hydrolase family 15 protein [Paenibacillus sp. CAU 1782]